jgi:release factor glutamine methyltransferase
MRTERLFSLGELRRRIQPPVLRWIRKSAERTGEWRVDRLSLTVQPTVFHPKYFGSSRILARYVMGLNLRGRTFLDMGTGSGFIGLQAARAGATVTAVDINPAAVDTVRLNADRNDIRMSATCSDLFSALPDCRYDVIAWNPPFFKREPQNSSEQAFFGGRNLETIRRFATELRDHMTEGGTAYIVLSADADIVGIRGMFLDNDSSFSTVHGERWMGEQMVVIEIRRTENAQMFLELYERIRRDEEWGGDDLDLPFRPLRHKEIWAIRRRTFHALRRFVFKTWAESERRGRRAIDAGAGNCWLSRHLDRWGFQTIAIDISAGKIDGLAAAEVYLRSGSHFDRVLATMQDIPLPDGGADLIVANASCHYTQDLVGLLREFRRVLRPEGFVVILDSPFYESAWDGERMLAERVREYREKYGAPEHVLQRVGYLTYRAIQESAEHAGLKCEFQPVWLGIRRSYEAWRARLFLRRIAQFPVVVLSREI